jgi:hypothetical protein
VPSRAPRSSSGGGTIDVPTALILAPVAFVQTRVRGNVGLLVIVCAGVLGIALSAFGL